MRRDWSDDAGFTLVELLVSMALLAIAAVLVAQSFAMERGDLLRIQSHAALGEDVAAAQDMIRARIQHLFAETQYDSVGAAVDMDGEAGRLEFQASTPDLLTPIRRYRVGLSPGGELMLIALGRESASNGAPMILLRGVQSLEFSYFGPSEAGAGMWRPEWRRQPAPPQLVRIRLGFADKDRRVWPELIVRPGVTVDQACTLDPDTGQCRARQ